MMKKRNITFITLAIAGLFISPAFSKKSSTYDGEKVLAMNSLKPIESYSSDRLVYQSFLSNKEKRMMGFEGDMRFRYKQSTFNLNSPNVFLRARGGIKGLISDNFSWKIRIASSGVVHPAVSLNNNQSAKKIMEGKAIWLDLAAFSYYFSDELKLEVGKMENPYHGQEKHNLLWNRDLHFEGASLYYIKDFSSNYKLNIKSSFFMRDPVVADITGIANHDINHASFTEEGLENEKYNFNKYLMASSVSFLVDEDQFSFESSLSTYFMNMNDTEEARASTLEGSYSTQDKSNTYGLVDIFFKFKVKDWGPLSLSVQLLQNYLMRKNSTGFVVGGKIGEQNKVKEFVFSFDFFNLKKNVTLEKYTDSDIGASGKNFDGYRLGMSYFLSSSVSMEAQYLMKNNKIGIYDDNRSEHVLFGSLSFNI